MNQTTQQPNPDDDIDVIFGAETICSETGFPLFSELGRTIRGNPETSKAEILFGPDWPDGVEAVEKALRDKKPVEFPLNDNLHLSDNDLLRRFSKKYGGTIKGHLSARSLVDANFEGSIGYIKIKDGDGYFFDTADESLSNKLPFPYEEPLRPVDLWAKSKHPELPEGVLPSIIEEYAKTIADQMGVDPGAVAASALAACAGALSDQIKVKVKRHAEWTESARLWVALVGNPSAKKSPILNSTTRHIRKIDGELAKTYTNEKRQYDKLNKADKETAIQPKNKRLVLEDTTVEAAQGVFADSSDGLLLVRDELSGWFGSMEKYSGSKGSSADRAFWLQSFNGGPYSVTRVGRGATYINNLSASLLGGIQPDPIRKIAADTSDDGLLQRLLPIVVGSAKVGKDEPLGLIGGAYEDLMDRLYNMQRAKSGKLLTVDCRFDDDAQNYRNELEQKHFDLMVGYETINRKLAAHVGKFDGIFARLALLFHCIETRGQAPDPVISFETAKRAGRFLHEFFLPHSRAFYRDVIGLTDHHDAVLATAGFILAHSKETISARDVARGDRTMRKLDSKDAQAVLERLEFLSWLEPMTLTRNQTKPQWKVVDRVHQMFDEKAAEERIRRIKVREMIESGI